MTSDTQCKPPMSMKDRHDVGSALTRLLSWLALPPLYTRLIKVAKVLLRSGGSPGIVTLFPYKTNARKGFGGKKSDHKSWHNLESRSDAGIRGAYFRSAILR